MIRLERHATFDDRTSVAPDFEAYSIRFSQATGQAALIEADVRMPVGGILGGPRYVSLYVDGNLVATGKISGFPSGLAGEIVPLTVICQQDDVSAQVDALYEQILVSEHLESKERVRRAEAYSPTDVYIHRVTGKPTLVPIGGVGAPAFVISGEGGGGAWSAYSASLRIDEAPINKLVLKVEAAWTEVGAALIDYGQIVGVVETYTPDEYESVIKSFSANGNGYHVFNAKPKKILGGGYISTPVTTRRAYVNPATGVFVSRKVVELQGRRYNPPILEIVTTAEEHRSEVLEFTFTAGINPDFQPRTENINLSITDAQRTISGEYFAVRAITLPGQTGEWLYETPVVAGQFFRTSREAELLNQNFADFAQKIILNAAHAMKVTLEVDAQCARSLTLRDRVTFIDANLQDGSVTGQVSAIEWTDGAEGIGRITIRCPVGTDATMPISSSYDLVKVGEITESPKMAALNRLDPTYFVKAKAISGVAEDQLNKINEINAQNNTQKPETDMYLRASEAIRRVRDFLPKPQINIQFRENGATDVVIESRLTGTLNFPILKGV